MVYAFMGRSLANFVDTKSPILLYQLLLVQDRRSGASNNLFLSARSPILSYNYGYLAYDTSCDLSNGAISNIICQECAVADDVPSRAEDYFFSRRLTMIRRSWLYCTV